MNKIKIILILTLILTGVQYISGQTHVAVMGFEGKGISDVDASALTDRLVLELFRTGEFKVLEREMLAKILEEQKFQVSGCVSTECLVEIGQVAGVQQIVSGSISHVGIIYSVSARLISVETGEIVNVAILDYEGQIGELLTYGMAEIASQLSGGKPMATGKTLNESDFTGKSPEKERRFPRQPDTRWGIDVSGSYGAEESLNYNAQFTYYFFKWLGLAFGYSEYEAADEYDVSPHPYDHPDSPDFRSTSRQITGTQIGMVFRPWYDRRLHLEFHGLLGTGKLDAQGTLNWMYPPRIEQITTEYSGGVKFSIAYNIPLFLGFGIAPSVSAILVDDTDEFRPIYSVGVRAHFDNYTRRRLLKP